MTHPLERQPAAPPAPDAKSARASRRQAILAIAVIYGAVALGSVIGGLLRALASMAIDAQAGSGFPLGTLFVNVTGSFVIGFYAALTGPQGRVPAGTRRRQFVMTGICGGYTTFSMFSLETFRLLQARDWLSAGLNIGVSVMTWLMAVWLGHMLAARLDRPGGA